MPPPADPAARAQLAELARRLADASARYATGAFATARALAGPIVQDARVLGYRPFAAEAEFLLGNVEASLGDLVAGQATLEAAVWSAEAGRRDDIAARAWTALVYLVGYLRNDVARGRELARRASAAVARLGDNPEIAADFEIGLAELDTRERKFDAAAGHEEAAVALATRAFGPSHPRLAKALESLGTTAMEQGHTDRGLTLLGRALRIYEAALGPDHPWVARTLHNLGNAHITLHYNALAEQELRRALALREASLGPDHPDLAETLCALGHALLQQGKLDDALIFDRRAVALGDRAFGPDDLVHVPLAMELGVVLGRLGHIAEAEALLREAETLATRALGPEHVQVLVVLAAQGELRMQQARWRDAAALYERAIPGLVAVPDAQDDLASAVAALGRAYVELHHPDRALTSLANLPAPLDSLMPEVRVSIELTQARALWDTGGDRSRAVALADRARAELGTLPGADRRELAAIERWRAGPPGPVHVEHRPPAMTLSARAR